MYYKCLLFLKDLSLTDLEEILHIFIFKLENKE